MQVCFIFLILTLAALSSKSSAAKKTLKIDLFERPSKVVSNRFLGKRTTKIAAHLESHHRLRSEIAHENIPLFNTLNTQFVGEVGFGSHNQRLQVQFDTGSPYVWIPSHNCSTACLFSSIDDYFDCDRSTTCVKGNFDEYYNFTYGMGFVEGHWIADDVWLDNHWIVDKNQSILYAMQVRDFGMLTFDGIIGLSFPDTVGPYQNYTPLMQNLKAQGVIDSIAFSFYLTTSKEKGSQLILGGYEDFYMDEPEMTHHPLIAENIWLIALNGVQVDNKSINIRTKSVLIDSGTSGLLVHQEFADGLVAELQRRGQKCRVRDDYHNQICCSTSSDITVFPILSFQIDEKTYDLGPMDYIWACGIIAPQSSEPAACVLAVMVIPKELETLIPFVILGEAFMRKYYTYFNLEEKTIGFAKSRAIMFRSAQESSATGFPIIFGGVCLLALGAYFTFRRMKKKY